MQSARQARSAKEIGDEDEEGAGERDEHADGSGEAVERRDRPRPLERCTNGERRRDHADEKEERADNPEHGIKVPRAAARRRIRHCPPGEGWAKTAPNFTYSEASR